jgi:hypothetical protein
MLKETPPQADHYSTSPAGAPAIRTSTTVRLHRSAGAFWRSSQAGVAKLDMRYILGMNQHDAKEFYVASGFHGRGPGWAAEVARN